MFFKLIKQSIVRFFAVSALVLSCSGVTVFAQSFIGQVDINLNLPDSNPSFPFNRAYWEGYTGYNTQIVVNPNTNRTYTHMETGLGGSSLVEINGADNSYRTIPIDGITTHSISIDTVRNRIYMVGYLPGPEAVLVAYNVNNDSYNVIPLPHGNSNYIGVNPVTNRLYVTTIDGVVYEINGEDFNITPITYDNVGAALDIAVNKATRSHLKNSLINFTDGKT